jgi:hypothetical protein
MGRGEGKGSMGSETPGSPVKQRGLYSEFLGDVSEELRDEVLQGPSSDRYTSQRSNVSASWNDKIQSYAHAAQTEDTVLDVALTKTDEPKLQVPFKTEPGQPPRQVLLEREKRFYADQDLAALLLEEGIDYSHGGDPGGEQYASFMVRIRERERQRREDGGEREGPSTRVHICARASSYFRPSSQSGRLWVAPVSCPEALTRGAAAACAGPAAVAVRRYRVRLPHPGRVGPARHGGSPGSACSHAVA